MPKRLTNIGKLLYVFTALFPLYLYWAYFFYTQVQPLSVTNLLNLNGLGFFTMVVLSILSAVIFYVLVMKKRKRYDKEIQVKESKKASLYSPRIIGSLSPFVLLIFSRVLDLSAAIVATAFFLILGLTIILRDETGILCNFFFIFYNINKVTTTKGQKYTVISKKGNLSGYIKVSQLDNGIYREWN